MDIEKLIEQLRYLADTPSYTAFHDAKEREIICDQCEADFCYDKQQDAHWCMYEALSRAATALSTLQAENEKLRADAVRLNDLLASYQNVLVPELRSELEQVKAEKDAAVESIPHECKTCVYHTVFFNGCTPDHDCTNPDGGCSNNYDRWQWRG